MFIIFGHNHEVGQLCHGFCDLTSNNFLIIFLHLLNLFDWYMYKMHEFNLSNKFRPQLKKKYPVLCALKASDCFATNTVVQ